MTEVRVHPSSYMQGTGSLAFPSMPLHWNFVPLRHVVTFVAGAGFPDIEQGQSAQELPFFKVRDLGLGDFRTRLSSSENSISYATAKRLRARVIPPNAVVFAKIGAALLLNRFRMIADPCCIDNNMMAAICTEKKILPEYAHWVLSRLDMTLIVNPGAVPSLNESKLAEIKIPVPSLKEQKVVVDFLGRETAKIDGLIAKQTEFLTLLDEHRRALITEAVTRGLDPSVPMCDTNTGSFPNVPAHWAMKPLKAIIERGTTITYGIVQAGPDIPSGVPYIRTSDMNGDVLPDGGYLRTSHEIDSAYSRSRVKSGDLVIAIRATVGKTLAVPEHLDGANLTQGTARISPGPQIKARFLQYVLNSPPAEQNFSAISKGATFKEITLEMLRNVRVPVPPPAEQIAIIDALDARIATLNSTRAKSAEMIERLRERRSALITAAVTGQFDVTSDPGIERVA